MNRAGPSECSAGTERAKLLFVSLCVKSERVWEFVAIPGRGFLMSPPYLESQGCQFDPNFLYLPVCSSALSCLYFCIILFCFWPILLNYFSLNLRFPKGRLFCLALVFVSLSGYERSILVGGMCSICCHMALVLAFMLVFLICNCFYLFWGCCFLNLVLKRQTEAANGTSIS